MKGAGAMEWVAIGLALVAVIVILRYGRRPRCELCRRRHYRRPGLVVLPSDVVPDQWFVSTPNGSAVSNGAPATEAPHADAAPPAEPGHDREPEDPPLDEADVVVDLTVAARAAEPEPDGVVPVAISWRADAPVPSPGLSSLN